MTHSETSGRTDGAQGSGTTTDHYEPPRIYELGSVADLTGGGLGQYSDGLGAFST